MKLDPRILNVAFSIPVGGAAGARTPVLAHFVRFTQ